MIQFTLQGPLQSWGKGKMNGGDYFLTDKKPTKSGIVGLIACVIGLKRKDPRIDEISDAITVYVRSYKNDGLMTDYHIVHGELYNANRENSYSSIVTHRTYIQGGKFDVIIEGEENLLQEITEAFYHPYWTPYLGRKSCPPSAPILPKHIDVLEEGFVKLKDTKHHF